MKKRTIFLFTCLIFSNLLSLSAQNVDMLKVLEHSDFYRGGSEGIAWNVQVQNYEQGTLKNDVSLLVEGSLKDGHFASLITFLAPRKFDGQKLLIRDNSMWFMKKGLTGPVPISSRQRLSGAAANADVVAANYIKDYTIMGVTEGSYNDTPCWILDLTAKNGLVTYPQIKYWITKKGSFGIHAAYYGKSEKLIKVADFEYTNKVNYQSRTYEYLSAIVISDQINKEDKTILKISDIKFPTFTTSQFQKDRLLD
jgi:Outer membrane lipoprotein-sorting protein